VCQKPIKKDYFDTFADFSYFDIFGADLCPEVSPPP